MKIFGVLGVIAVIAGGVVLTQLERVEAGYVGVKVDLLGDDKGVIGEEVGPGRYWVGINEDLYRFPTFSQNETWTSEQTDGSPAGEGFTFQSNKGLDISADIGITYSVDPEKVSILFQRYRKGIDEITDTYMRNMVRDSLANETSKMAVEAIYGEGKADLMDRVEDTVRAEVAPHGIIVEKLYWIGKLGLPNEVITAINSEITSNSQARQRANEVATADAEANKERKRANGEADAILAVATAQAEANKLLNDTLTPELVQYQAMQKWNGVLPLMTGGDATPMINISDLTQ
jgi:regulator of protease activity HflC (stomatin/prohibitin superfamily)